MVERALAVSFIGSPATIEAGLAPFLAELRPDELMITAHLHDQSARLRSIELIAQVRERLGAADKAPAGIVAGAP